MANVRQAAEAVQPSQYFIPLQESKAKDDLNYNAPCYGTYTNQ